MMRTEASEFEALLHPRGGADDALPLEGDRRFSCLLLLPVLEGSQEGEHHLLDGGGLLDVVPGAVLDRELRPVGVAVPRHDDDLRGWGGDLPDLREDVEAGAVGHADVEEDDVVEPGGDLPHPLLEGMGR